MRVDNSTVSKAWISLLNIRAHTNSICGYLALIAGENDYNGRHNDDRYSHFRSPHISGKRCRMPHPGPFFSPVCRRIPDSEFNCIERFLYQFFYLYRIGIIPISEQARHPRIANKHSMRIYILTKLQKFIITESVSTPVSPQIVFTGSGHPDHRSSLSTSPGCPGSVLRRYIPPANE